MAHCLQRVYWMNHHMSQSKYPALQATSYTQTSQHKNVGEAEKFSPIITLLHYYILKY